MMHLFKNPLFVVVNLAAALASGFLMGIDVYIPMWMQGVLGLNAAIGGLVLAPLSLVWMVGSFLASKWMTQMKTHWVLRIGLLIAAIGALGCILCLSEVTIYGFLLYQRSSV